MALSQRAQRRLNNIQEPTNTSASWYLMGLNYCLMIGSTLKTQLLRIPGYIFPDNPAKNSFFPGIGGWSFLTFLSPVLLFLSWYATYKACKNLYYATNRNYVRYAHAIVSLLSSSAWTALYIVGLAASTYVALLVLPYLAAAIFAMHAAYGLFNFVKDLYKAYKAESAKERHAHLWNAAKHLLHIVTNSLAFTINMLIGIRVNAALERMTNSIPSMLKTMYALGNYFKQAVPYVYALTAVTVVGLAAETAKFNAKTWKMLWSPIETGNKVLKYLKSNPLKLIPLLMRVALRIAALPLAPIQIIFYGFYSLFFAPSDKPATAKTSIEKPKKQNCDFILGLMSKHEKAKALAAQTVAEVKQADFETPQNKEYKELVFKIIKQIKKIETQQIQSETKLRRAQHALLKCVLLEKMGVQLDVIDPQFKNHVIYKSNFENVSKMDLKEFLSIYGSTLKSENFQFNSERSINDIINSVRADKNYHKQVFNDFFSDVGEVEALINSVEDFQEKHNPHPMPSIKLDRVISGSRAPTPSLR